jgi:hypothetical protein
MFVLPLPLQWLAAEGVGMSMQPGLQQQYVDAVAFASDWLEKDRQALDKDDLARALGLAQRVNRHDLTRPLRILIEFKGVRDLYCRELDMDTPSR